MSLNKLFIPLCFIAQLSWGQLSVDNLNYRYRIENSTRYFLDKQELHSGILPLLFVNDSLDKTRQKGELLHFSKINTSTNKSSNVRLYPITDLGAGVEYLKNQNNPLKYTTGIGLGLDFSSTHFFASGKLMPYYSSAGFVADSIQQKFDMDLGTTRPIIGKLFQRNDILLAYKLNSFFTFVGGYGKNFFGEGYRSLLLSDNAANYPFFKIETSFSSIKYVNLYTIWNDNVAHPSNKSFDKMKFSSLHYLSWNITREFNLSVFESVVWQAKDTLVNRGFDVNYLNPVVFYRPVEYANGSADNVLLGLNLSYKFNKNHCVYHQIVIDEFLLSKIKDKSKWWGNKWGIQLGYKSNSFIVKDLYFQTEFNVVRPFTYSHKYSSENYGHLNASVTHPLGANFYEVLNILSYKKNKIRFTNKITFSAYGVDYDSTNYGQNIFNSYSDRKGDYGHLIMQGLRTNVLNEQLIVEAPLFPKINMYLNVTYNYRMQYNSTQITHNHFLMIGIRSRIWNFYSDI